MACPPIPLVPTAAALPTDPPNSSPDAANWSAVAESPWNLESALPSPPPGVVAITIGRMGVLGAASADVAIAAMFDAAKVRHGYQG